VVNRYLGEQDDAAPRHRGRCQPSIHAAQFDKNKEGKRDPEMHQTKKRNQYYFGMKGAHWRYA